MSIDWFTFAAQIINFAVLIALLNRFLYRPISEAIAKRESDIQDKLVAAHQQESQAAETKERYENLTREIEDRRQAMLDEAGEETRAFRKQLMKDARNEVQFRRRNWLKSLLEEQESVINHVMQKSGEQVVAISARVLENLADEKLEQRVIERFLHDLENLSTEERSRLQAEAGDGLAYRIETAFPISSQWQERIRNSLNQHLDPGNIQFETDHQIALGINLRVGGLKIGWNVREYLDTLQAELQDVVKQQ